MPSPQNFDNLNGLFFTKRSKNRAMSINQFFGEMNLPEEEEERRRMELSKKLLENDNDDLLDNFFRDMQNGTLNQVKIDDAPASGMDKDGPVDLDTDGPLDLDESGKDDKNDSNN